MKVAIVGAGIAGLAAAHRLAPHAQTTLFEAGATFGGHAHTVNVTLPGEHGPVTHGVDTGFLVLNERTYPQLLALFAELGVVTAPSEMSFSVQVPRVYGSARAGMERHQPGERLCPAAQPGKPTFCRHAARPAALQPPLHPHRRGGRRAHAGAAAGRFPGRAALWRRLSRLVPAAHAGLHLELPDGPDAQVPGGHHDSLLPQPRPAASGEPPAVVHRGRRFAPLRAENRRKGLPDARCNTPVRRIERDAAGVRIATDAGTEHFDRLVLATHSDQALALLAQPSSQERALLGAIRYQANRAVLHTDTRVLPQRRAAWAAWNYERAPQGRQESARVCLHYLINRLQPLPFAAARHRVAQPPGRHCARAGAGRVRLRPPGVRRGRHPCPAPARTACRASSAPGLPAPGRATVSTKTG
ncbi:MAG: FAD-dependent oxidoreductase [Giesbergeria sp.]